MIRRAASLGLLLAACAPAEIGTAGARVAVRAAPTEGCTLVGPVRASAGYNGRSAAANAAGVEAALRNEAARLGADTLVIRERTSGAPPVDPLAPRAGIGSGGCPACVAMAGDAYRCPNDVAPARTEAAVDAFAVAADTAIAAALESARSCLPHGAAPREARLLVTFAPTGDVAYAEAEGEGLSGTPEGACVAGKLRNGHVAAFHGQARSIRKVATLTR